MMTLYLILFVLLLVSGISGLVVQQTFLSRLRKRHTRTWEQLGKPVIFLNSGALNTIDLLRFLWRRDYESLDDTKTVKLGRFLRGFLLFYFALLVLTVGVFIFLAALHKRPEPNHALQPTGTGVRVFRVSHA